MSEDISFSAQIYVKNQKYMIKNNENIIKIIRILEKDLKEKVGKEKKGVM